MKKKLSVLLATTDQLAPQFKKSIGDTGKFFKINQSAFKGIKKTYEPLPDTVDDASKRGVTNVVTTVSEKLGWVKETTADYINALFSQEKTNASGKASAELIVEGNSWGTFTTLELMRLKGILESSELTGMYAEIPVREETKTWNPTSAENYADRKIFEDKLVEGDNNTTEKESYIIQDPNVQAAIAAGKELNYQPILGQKTKTVKLGTYTVQNFTGEASHRERAEALRKITILKTAVLEALKLANDVETIESEMTSEKIFGYLNGSF